MTSFNDSHAFHSHHHIVENCISFNKMNHYDQGSYKKDEFCYYTEVHIHVFNAYILQSFANNISEFNCMS